MLLDLAIHRLLHGSWCFQIIWDILCRPVYSLWIKETINSSFLLYILDIISISFSCSTMVTSTWQFWEGVLNGARFHVILEESMQPLAIKFCLGWRFCKYSVNSRKFLSLLTSLSFHHKRVLNFDKCHFYIYTESYGFLNSVC